MGTKLNFGDMVVSLSVLLIFQKVQHASNSTKLHFYHWAKKPYHNPAEEHRGTGGHQGSRRNDHFFFSLGVPS
jgi:hypothetical protein